MLHHHDHILHSAFSGPLRHARSESVSVHFLCVFKVIYPHFFWENDVEMGGNGVCVCGGGIIPFAVPSVVAPGTQVLHLFGIQRLNPFGMQGKRS